ncbi:ABC a-pheromone efflux pump [Seiridium cupressi]
MGVTLSAVAGALRASLAILLGQLFGVISSYGRGALSGPDTMTEVARWCSILVIVGSVGVVVNFAFMFTWVAFSDQQARHARREVFHALLAKDLEWFDLQSNGISSLLVRTQNDLKELQYSIYVGLGNISIDTMTALANLLVAFYLSWTMTLILLATVPPSVIIVNLLGNKLEPAIETQKQELAVASKHALSAITAIDIVKTFNGADQEIWQYSDAIKRSMKAYLIQSRANAYQMGYVKFWLEITFVIGFYYGVVLVSRGTNAGVVITTFYAALAALQAVHSSLSMNLTLAKGMSAGQYLQHIISGDRMGFKAKKMVGTRQPEAWDGEIKFHNLSFVYPSRPSPSVLREVCMCFPPRRFTFLVGPSGAGKSTVGDLLVKLYEPTAGDITIDGVPLRTLDTNWVRSNITVVQQHPTLFDGTLFENIALGLPDPTKASKTNIMNACQATLLQSTIADLPSGLDTHVGRHGHNLSGGQIQRVALARAFVRDPEILILDEVTSGLEASTRILIMDAIRDARQNKTTIVITHDMAQIEENDCLCMLEGGHTVQEGLGQLLQNEENGLRTQNLSSNDDCSSQVIDTCHPPGCETRCETDTAPNRFSPTVPPVPVIPTMARASQAWTPISTGNMYGWMGFAIGSPALRMRHSNTLCFWDASNGSATTDTGQSPSVSIRSLDETGQGQGNVTGANGDACVGQWRPAQKTPGEDPKALRKSSRAPSRDTIIQDIPMLPPNMGRTSLISLQKQGYHVRHTQERDGNFRRRQEPDASRESTIHDDQNFDHFTITRSKMLHHSINAATDRDTKPMSLLLIYKSVWPHLETKARWCLFAGLLSCLIVSASIPAFSVVLASLLSVLYAKNDATAVGQKWALILLLVASIGASAAFLAHFSMEYTGQSWVNALRTEAFTCILAQPRPFFAKSKHAPAGIVQCMDRNAEQMRNLVGRFAPSLLIVVAMVLASVMWAVIISWRLALVALSSMSFLIAAAQGYSYANDKWEARCNKVADAGFTIMTETFSNIRTVKVLTLERHFSRKHEHSLSQAHQLGIKKAIWTAALFACCQAVSWFIMGLIFYYATVLLAVQAHIQLEEVVKVVNLLVLGLGASSQMAESIPAISAVQVTAGRLLYYANLPLPGKNDNNHATKPPPSNRDLSHQSTLKTKRKLASPFPIRMDGLSFTYHTRSGIPLNPVLNNLTLELKSGSAVAIVGQSGCGKSTLASILLTLRKPTTVPQVRNIRPSICRHPLSFAGHPPDLLDPVALRSQMAYVSQHPFLFPTSIKRNITYGLPETSPLLGLGNIERAARQAGILDFLDSLPDGLDTMIGEGGQPLSAGQAQRICLARALVRRPKLLVLDEPTSSLDPETAFGIRRTILRLIEKARGTVGIMPSPLHGRYEHKMRNSDETSTDVRNSDVSIVVITHNIEMMKTAVPLPLLPFIRKASCDDDEDDVTKITAPSTEPTTGIPMQRFFGAKSGFGFGIAMADGTNSSSFIGQLYIPFLNGANWRGNFLTCTFLCDARLSAKFGPAPGDTTATVEMGWELGSSVVGNPDISATVLNFHDVEFREFQAQLASVKIPQPQFDMFVADAGRPVLPATGAVLFGARGGDGEDVDNDDDSDDNNDD